MASFSQITKLTAKKINKNTTLYIWISKINKLSNSLLFITGQDSSGHIQIVVKSEELILQLKERKKGDLLKIEGIIKKKEGSEGKLEIELTKYQLVNPSKE